jgi:hypothetical protein
MLENINCKTEGLSSSVKNQLSFNKMIETKLAQIAAPFLLIKKERSRGNLRILLKKLTRDHVGW